MTVTKEMIEAACAATVLGEDENYQPFHLEPREARIALEAAMPFLAQIAAEGDEVEAVAKMMWERFSSPHADDWENETHKSEYRLAATDVLVFLSSRSAEAGKPVVKGLDDSALVKLMYKHLPPKVADDLTIDKHPPMFPQAEYSVPTLSARNFVDALFSALSTPADSEPIGYVTASNMRALKGGLQGVMTTSAVKNAHFSEPLYAAPVADGER